MLVWMEKFNEFQGELNEIQTETESQWFEQNMSN